MKQMLQTGKEGNCYFPPTKLQYILREKNVHKKACEKTPLAKSILYIHYLKKKIDKMFVLRCLFKIKVFS